MMKLMQVLVWATTVIVAIIHLLPLLGRLGATIAGIFCAHPRLRGFLQMLLRYLCHAGDHTGSGQRAIAGY